MTESLPKLHDLAQLGTLHVADFELDMGPTRGVMFKRILEFRLYDKAIARAVVVDGNYDEALKGLFHTLSEPGGWRYELNDAAFENGLIVTRITPTFDGKGTHEVRYT